ncbi:response regulator [Pseudomonas sp. CVAP|uniref:hybrid sensor histidine kinase/response regulator n=1 Tax=Pseudomonas sp. CVAP\|nr:hybrid sensor histidine kinase/response regulator [Pseudomonas sp. CVAP\
MKHDNALLEKLTRSSLRLNKGLMVLLGVALLFVGTSYWLYQRVVKEQYHDVRFHFSRLMENIQEQESFLKTLSQLSHQDELLNDENVEVHLQKMPLQEGVYKGQEFPFSMPFSIKLNQQKIAATEHPKVFALGVHLTNFYGGFWSASHYQSPQVFLFNHQDNFDIAVPAAGHLHGNTANFDDTFSEVIKTVQGRLNQSSQPLADGEVYWEHYGETINGSTPARLLAYINIQLNPEMLHINGADPRVVVATLLDMSQVNDVERTMEWSIYDHFTLVAPSGEVLTGSLRPQSPLNEGVNFKPDGLVFKITNSEGPQWVAIYAISFKSFFRYALWPLTSLAILLTSVIIMGWLASRWYKKQVILPARRAHESIAESEAFSRVVIDTAPTGLCVVRRSDDKVLVENQRAQQWQGTAKLMTVLDPRHNSTDVGETYLEVEGRHLQVGFVSTRYQGQDVRLYAFNDVTRHIEDAAALEEARRAADAANEAKTLFLATMSHEIRTPLYGVLGTLELLGMTRLDSRQQEYLQTIQRSSATLFQLISDVLDVSKIESGQMAIESIEFCPLDMLEDTLHTYAAFAQSKGLQLYACIDPALPNRLLGDPMRIRQILNNLLSNAIKFTDTGRVVLRARVLEHSDDQVSLEWQVTDSGIGISEPQQAKLFELFYQVRDASCEGGAGLGLPICGWLSEMMGGQMKVVSEPGLGSSFALLMSLPVLAGELPDCPTIEPVPLPVYVQAPVRELAQTLCDWLNRLGIHATLATSPLEQKHPQAVLVDILPSDPEQPWDGPRVRCTSGGRNPPEYTNNGWEVDMHDVRAIALAVSLAQQGKREQPRQAEPQRAGNLHLHILVAEDNPINQAIIKEQLEALGCSVVVAANGEQAMHLWRPEVFDVVLTDVNMPLMNGYELAQTLREHDPLLPIIGVTANAMREEGMRCIAVGMNAWIVKPLSLQTLRAHLVKLCKPALQAVPTRVESETITALPRTPATDTVQLSPKMRPLFISTLQQDMQRINAALEQSDCRILGERLHSIAGALGAVQAIALAQECVDLECSLAGAILDTSLALRVKQILGRLSNVLDALE